MPTSMIGCSVFCQSPAVGICYETVRTSTFAALAECREELKVWSLLVPALLIEREHLWKNTK